MNNPILYSCDPAKNIECRKTGCFQNGGPCHATVNEEYAELSEDKQPIHYTEYCLRANKIATDDLLPCPFCGGRAVLEKMGWPHHVYCTECGAKVTSIKYDFEGEAEACEKWNRREVYV